MDEIQRHKILAITGLLVLLAVGALEKNLQSRSGVLSGAREKILSLVTEKKVPSVSLAVIRNGEIIWEEAFGLANIEKRMKATTETLYPIASATKPFTATALMILVERGIVDLDKPANAYLGKVKLRSFEGDASEATVRRILRHTSGLPMYWNFYYAGSSRQRPPLETTLERYGRLMSKPGESYNYSNLGYAVLESIIEHVSGRPYSEFLKAEVFIPLNLRQTSVCTSPPEGLNVAEKYASTLVPIPFCDHDTRGASAIYATARDLALFSLLHLGRLQPDQKAILKPEAVAAMQRSRDRDVTYSSYALGWETGKRFGFPIVTHGGVMDGCRAHIAMIPSEGLAAAVLINGENFRSIQVCDWIFASLLPEYARNLKSASPGGVTAASPPAFRPPAELVGAWKGSIKTHEEDILVRLVVESDGRVELFRMDSAGAPGNAHVPLKPPSVNHGIFVVHLPQVFSTSDASSASHRTVLGMKIQKNRLSGEANTIASDMSYSLPSYIELKRTEFVSLTPAQQPRKWVDKPSNEWPQITMINRIEYVDKTFPIAACSFLLAAGSVTLAVTAKHVLTYFKSDTMTTVSFANRLKSWVMYPKNNPADSVVIDALINEDPGESIDRAIPSDIDWLLFTIKSKSNNIQPLKFRTDPLQPQEKVYIIGWRYTDKDCPQVIYEGNYVESIDGSVIISTKILSDNRTPGLSGAPVIDTNGCLIGIMSQKYGKMEKLGSIQYPKRIVEAKYR